MLLLCISHSGGEYPTSVLVAEGGLLSAFPVGRSLWVAGLKLRRPTQLGLWEKNTHIYIYIYIYIYIG